MTLMTVTAIAGVAVVLVSLLASAPVERQPIRIRKNETPRRR